MLNQNTDEEIVQAVKRLICQIPQDKLILLPALIDQVIDTTGYGDVKIIIANGRVEMFKAEISYR